MTNMYRMFVIISRCFILIRHNEQVDRVQIYSREVQRKGHSRGHVFHNGLFGVDMSSDCEDSLFLKVVKAEYVCEYFDNGDDVQSYRSCILLVSDEQKKTVTTKMVSPDIYSTSGETIFLSSGSCVERGCIEYHMLHHYRFSDRNRNFLTHRYRRRS